MRKYEKMYQKFRKYAKSLKAAALGYRCLKIIFLNPLCKKKFPHYLVLSEYANINLIFAACVAAMLSS
jgi:hypothetical protein